MNSADLINLVNQIKICARRKSSISITNYNRNNNIIIIILFLCACTIRLRPFLSDNILNLYQKSYQSQWHFFIVMLLYYCNYIYIFVWKCTLMGFNYINYTSTVGWKRLCQLIVTVIVVNINTYINTYIYDISTLYYL